MNKYAFACITSLFFLFQPLHAGGPWLVYKAVIDGQGSIFPLNLAYDNGPQFAFTEQDSDEEVNLKYNTKTKKIWNSIQNQWHRLSWGRQGNTFGLLYSQYEVVGAEGTADHGVYFATGTCVAWPNKGKSIGVTGKYPQTLKFQMLRLDGGWNGSALGTGSRQLKQWNLIGTLDIALTKALNDARGTLSTNLDAKNWIINYFVTTLRYTQTADVNEY
ncbi:MAG: hypothetical protein EBT30_05985 [Verrucomicrobia bacterium]|nr:hypothetical protein [Verrucomicrobiota bacterium]